MPLDRIVGELTVVEDVDYIPVPKASTKSSSRTSSKFDDIVPFEMAQIPKVLFATGWTNHQIIMSRCKTDTERLFYMLYAGKERLENKELIRIIKIDTMNSLLGGKDVQSEVMAKTYPSSPLLFKDRVYLEMLGAIKNLLYLCSAFETQVQDLEY